MPLRSGGACAVLLLAAAGNARAAAQKPDEGPGDLFTGISVPANATDLYGAEASFRLGGWNSTWGEVKLLELVADGTPVKAGDKVARFEFPGRDALRWVNEKIQKTKADANQAKISGDQTLGALVMEKRRKELEARLAGIEVEKERAVSRKQGDLYRIARKVADFEVDAITKRIGAARRSKLAEDTYQDESVKKHEALLARYGYYERKFQMVAPHDGIVRHAFSPRERRKVQKGDSIRAGMKVMSVAKDATLAVKFFVPEHRIAEISEGKEVTVTTAASAEAHRAVVKQIDFFPQELGFLTENHNLPNGREKAFAVTAEFVEAPAGLPAGAEVRVNGRPR